MIRNTMMIAIFLVVCCGLPGNADETSVLIIEADKGTETINKNIYGHFAEHLGHCIYGGIWVGEESTIPNTRGIRNDVVAALKKIEVPVLRWPGGCFADEYHWMDGIGPKDQRPPMVNTHWGMVTENNHFGTHEFLDLCDMLDTEPYICGNVGSGSVLEMQQWVEYLTYDGDTPMANLRRQNGREEPWKIKYWGVGNESWGCGGNMKPEYYADLYLRYQTYLRNFSGNQLYKIAVGPHGIDDHWTETLMEKVGRRMNGYSIHYYCGTGKNSRSATQFEEEDWFEQLRRALEIDGVIQAHSRIMDKYDPRKRIGLIMDEWGAWHAVEPGTNPGFLYQQNSLRDALVAGVSLNIMNQHCDRVTMANIAQTVNVLQAMVLTQDEKMLLTPTYHVYEMFKGHQDATLLPTHLVSRDYAFGDASIPALNASASKDENGTVHVSVCNLDPVKPAALDVEFLGLEPTRVAGRILTSEKITDHNTFDAPNLVQPATFTKAAINGQRITAEIPPKSVVVLEIQ
jgi:alpha-L-arabinofuranosidase